METILITGATRGLGLATARAARDSGARVLCAGRDPQALAAVARKVGGEPVLLDLARLDSVYDVLAALPHVDAVACNAGLQILHGPTVTSDGIEETLQVNHLAHLALVDGLLSRDRPPARIAFVGSATHDPAVRTGTPDPLSDPVGWITRAGRGEDDGSRIAGLRRYTTTKLLAAATAAGLARERDDVDFWCFDPGLLPGTGLARQQPAPVRALWATAFRMLRVLPFASSATASGRAFAALLLREPSRPRSGAYVDHSLREIPASAQARDPGFQDAVLRASRQALAATMPAAGGSDASPPR